MNLLFRLHGIYLRLLDLLYQLFSYFSFGNRLKISAKARIVNTEIALKSGRSTIGRNTVIWGELSTSKISLNGSVQISKDCDIDCSGGLEIEDGVLISERVKIFTHTHGLYPKARPIPKRLKCGTNAWIGSDVIVLSSVNFIGANSVVGSGSVLTKDVPEGEIWAGNPARKIGSKICVE